MSGVFLTLAGVIGLILVVDTVRSRLGAGTGESGPLIEMDGESAYQNIYAQDLCEDEELRVLDGDGDSTESPAGIDSGDPGRSEEPERNEPDGEPDAEPDAGFQADHAEPRVSVPDTWDELVESIERVSLDVAGAGDDPAVAEYEEQATAAAAEDPVATEEDRAAGSEEPGTWFDLDQTWEAPDTEEEETWEDAEEVPGTQLHTRGDHALVDPPEEQVVEPAEALDEEPTATLDGETLEEEPGEPAPILQLDLDDYEAPVVALAGVRRELLGDAPPEREAQRQLIRELFRRRVAERRARRLEAEHTGTYLD